MKSYRPFITNVLYKASVVARRSFGKVAGVMKDKDSNQVLTQTDLRIGRLLALSIQKMYPAHNIIDEELGVLDKGSEYTWVVDPIDGTSNFASGVPTYGIMIGLLQRAAPIAGGIALPYFKKVYSAERGQGTYCNGKRVKVTRETDVVRTLVAYQIDGHRENPVMTRREMKLLPEIALSVLNIRTSSSAFDFGMVAEGRYGGLLNRTSKIWDNVAPHIVIEEAGGLYTDFFGNPIDYANPLSKKDANFTCCAAPRALHKQLQRIIHHR